MYYHGGTILPNSGAELILYGKTAPATGHIEATVPNAAGNSIPALTIHGNTNTPTIDMCSNRVVVIGQATTDMDAVPITKMWGTYTPTLVWTTATPAALTTVARYCQIGKTVFVKIFLYSADSNATSGLTITLPVVPATINARIACAAFEQYGASGTTYKTVTANILADGADNKINFMDFTTATDGQAIGISVSCEYEAV
jgi:hypothetical protein